MMVVRLVVLALLFYIAWSLIRSLSDRKGSGRGAGADGDGEDALVQDTLVEDPVCHKLVPKHQAVRLRQDGETYYFCSDECCDTFIEAPRGEE